MKRLFNNTFFTSIDYFVVIALNLLATPILISNFGVTEYGVFIFLSVFSIDSALSFFDLGMEGSLMNYVARFQAANDKKKLHDSLTISLIYYSVIGLILGIALYYSADFIASRMLDEHGLLNLAIVKASIVFVSINVFLQFLSLPLAAILQGMRLFVITKSVNSFLTVFRYLLLIVVSIKFGRIDLAFMIIAGLTLVKLLIFTVVFVFRLQSFKGYRPGLNPALAKTLFSYSSILFVSRLVGLICNQVDKFLIWLYLAVSNMTIYDVVSRPANILRLVLSILNSAIVPEVARLHHQNDLAAIRRLYIKMVRYAYMASLPALALLYVNIDRVLTLWVGEEFREHSYLTMILLTVYLVLPIPSIASTMVVGLEKVRQTIWIPVVATVINVALSIALMKMIGLAGLYIATLCAEFFGLFPYLRAMERFIKISPLEILKPMIGIFGLGIGATALHYLVRQVFSGNIPMTLTGAGLIFSLNYYASYKYLLDKREREFVMERLRMLRSGKFGENN